MTRGKNTFALILLICITFTFTGCSKYEKDTSYDTDLYGSYSWEMGTYNDNNTEKITKESSIQYYSYAMYKFNLDNTYQYVAKEISSNEITQDINEDGKILSIEEISDDISKITLDKESFGRTTDEFSNLVMYKYKNMIGFLDVAEIPNGKNFDLIIPTPFESLSDTYPNAANIFDKNGFYHSCMDSTNCNDTEENYTGVYYKYIRKDNLIYFIDPNIENMDYQILYYIVGDGLFSPHYYKTE